MKTYIALLRGINVSGHNIIKMETLRNVLQELDFSAISTYIQSGNILFQSKISDPKLLEEQIAGIIHKHFGFDVPVTIVTPEELQKILKDNPYQNHKIRDPAQPYVAFLSEIPAVDKLEVLSAIDFKGDNFINIEKALYLRYTNPAGNSKLSNAIIENKLKLKSTVRNWKTILKLIELASEIN